MCPKHLERSRVRFTGGQDREIGTFNGAKLNGQGRHLKDLDKLLKAETGNVVEEWKEDLYGWEEDSRDQDFIGRDPIGRCSP